MQRFVQKRFTQNFKILAKKSNYDLERARQTAKVTKTLIAAVRAGKSSDPLSNMYLASALSLAKKLQVPKAKIDAALADRSGTEGESRVYEGIACGLAFVIECITPNLNKTAQDLRLIFKKANGSLSGTKYLFFHGGRLLAKGDSISSMTDVAIEGGAEDFAEIDENTLQITCSLENLQNIKNALNSFELLETQIGYFPLETVEAQSKDLQSILEQLEALDEVVAIYHNASKS